MCLIRLFYFVEHNLHKIKLRFSSSQRFGKWCLSRRSRPAARSWGTRRGETRHTRRFADRRPRSQRPRTRARHPTAKRKDKSIQQIRQREEECRGPKYLAERITAAIGNFGFEATDHGDTDRALNTTGGEKLGGIRLLGRGDSENQADRKKEANVKLHELW